MANKIRSKCLCCGDIFTVDARNRGRQKYCRKRPCRAAGKAARQRRWLGKPENRDYFRGPKHVHRLRVWRAEHPAYWRTHRRGRGIALQDALALQVVESPEDLARRALQDDIASTTRRLLVYAYVGGNPASITDPLGLWGVGDPLPDGLANSVTGFGDGIYRVLTFGFGNLNEFRNAIAINRGVDLCSVDYASGRNAGYLWAGATLWAAGLNGGANPVFWSGRGASAVAETLGMPIQNTAIGSLLNSLGVENRLIWSIASATYALNATGTPTAVINWANPNSIWMLEQTILELRGLSFKYF